MTTDLHGQLEQQRDNFRCLAQEMDGAASVVAQVAADGFERIRAEIARCAGDEPMARAAR